MTLMMLGVAGKSSKQRLKCTELVMALLLCLIVGEYFLQKQLTTDSMCSTQAHQSTTVGSSLPRGDDQSVAVNLAKAPTVHDVFGGDAVVHWDNLTELVAPQGLRTYVEKLVSDVDYGMSPLKNVCVRPNGTIVVVGVSELEFGRDLADAGEAMVREWAETYNCSLGSCNGAAFQSETPEHALWISGRTTHIVPYLGNVFHHFAERVWPILTGDPGEVDGKINQTSRTDFFYVHRMHTWLEQAHHNMDRNTFMFQIALLSRLADPSSRPRFFQHREDEARPLCFETLELSYAASGRMSPKLGLRKFAPAMARYRDAAFTLFQVAPPEVPLPPRPLRVTLYGRGDASRRRVTNIAEVAQWLRSSVTQPPLVVTLLDELMERGTYHQSLPEVVSLMAQTDVFITPHGASTWSTMFMPKRSAVIEIYGPCGPGTWISDTVVPALKLKHRAEGNPWGARVASPMAGNTTECRSALETPDFTIDINKLRDEIQSLRTADGPGDRLPLHWLFDWSTNSYL